MQRRMKLVLVSVLALSTLGLAGPARAEVCAGTQNIFHICVEPTGGTLYEDCVYVVDPQCIYVRVPGPVVTRCGNTQISCM